MLSGVMGIRFSRFLGRASGQELIAEVETEAHVVLAHHIDHVIQVFDELFLAGALQCLRGDDAAAV